MQVFSSMKCDLPQTQDFVFLAFSGQEYTIFGIASPTVKTLVLDGEVVPIAPVTYTWSKRVTAPVTNTIAEITHSIQYFGRGSDPHDLASGSNYLKVTIKPSCS